MSEQVSDTLTVIGRAGLSAAQVIAQRGGLAAVRLTEDSDRVSVTHCATGKAVWIGRTWHSDARAVAVMEAALTIGVDWTTETVTVIKALLGPARIAELRRRIRVAADPPRRSRISGWKGRHRCRRPDYAELKRKAIREHRALGTDILSWSDLFVWRKRSGWGELIPAQRQRCTRFNRRALRALNEVKP